MSQDTGLKRMAIIGTLTAILNARQSPHSEYQADQEVALWFHLHGLLQEWEEQIISEARAISPAP